MIDEFHKHELLDRVHCINEMYQVLISDHPAADLIRAEIDAVGGMLADLYQKAGELKG
jgi:hypothetical protein